MADNSLTEISQRTGLMGESSGRQRLSSEASESYVQSALKQVTASFTDNKSIQSEVSHYGAGFLKTAALFMPGRVGLAGSIIIGGLDQATPGSSGRDQVTDFAMGALKGAGMKGIMHAMGSERMPEFVAKSPAVQGVAFGVSNRILDVALTRQNYLDRNGNIDASAFGSKMIAAVSNPSTLLSDAATFVVAQGLVSGVTKVKPQFFESSPLARTMATSASFGLTNGASAEIMRQQDAHEKFDLSKVIGRSLLQGGVDALAGAPGGMRVGAISRVNEFPVSESSPAPNPFRAVERAPGVNLQPAAAQLADQAMRSSTPDDFHSSFAASASPEHISMVTNDGSITRFVQVDDTSGGAKIERQPLAPEQEKSFIGPLERRAQDIKALTIPERSLEAQPQRLTSYKSEVQNLPERSDEQGPFSDFDDFYKRGVKQVPTDVRNYKISGHNVEVIIPERYASRLDDTAAQKPTPVGEEDYFNRLAPSDLPPLLDAMPNSGYFKKIHMSDKRNPEDAWVSQGGYNSDFTSAMSMVEGELSTYKSERTDYLRRDVLHEWSHELRYEYWDHDIAFRFRNAVDLETDWKPSLYAGRNNGEQWAVLGERMLGNDAGEFLEAAEKAPIRSVIWMRALKLCLDNVSADNKSVDHDFYVARQRYVDEKILPLAVEKLDNFVKTGTSDQARWAQDVLDYFESEGLISKRLN